MIINGVASEYDMPNSPLLEAYKKGKYEHKIASDNYEYGYQIGFRDGVDDTTKRAMCSIFLRDKHIEDFIDFVNENGTNQEITDDNELRDFLQEQFDFYKEQNNDKC